MTQAARKTITLPRISRPHPLRWLMRLDAAYRQHQALKSATPGQLDDMGISREDADIAFYRQFTGRKIS
ncbi:MAG: hypothetical protein ACE5FS_09805 [Paracoccaceae bacterium]